ncbi:MAG: M6 family metalloprotease domain-containing protein, partial [bacterium]
MRRLQRLETTLLLLIISLFAGVALAMPPSPEVVQHYRERGELPLLAQKLAKMRAAGADQLEPLSFSFPARTSLSADTARLRVLVILVDFSDNPASGGAVADATAADFYDILFSRGVMPFGSLTEFYLENSYGNLLIEGEVAGWYRMPLTYAEYHGYQYGTQWQQPNAQTMAKDACIAADPDIDFSLYDNDGDGTVEGIFVVHAGRGAEESSGGDTLHIWSHAWNVAGGYQSQDGVTVMRYSTEPEEATGTLSHIGVFCHEFGHTLGLPDLYDVSYLSTGIGDWGLMSGGSWNGGGQSPSHFCGWSKYVLDSLYGVFGQTINVTGNLSDVVLNAAEADSVRYRIMLPTVSGKEYFMVENRRQQGFDYTLPGAGLLIWHCDDNIPGSNDLEHDDHLRIALEQADGLFQLENNQGSGDAYDAYPGPLGESVEFSDRSWPDNSSNYGASNQISVWNIKQDSETGAISCNIDIMYSRANLMLNEVQFSDATYGDGDGICDPGERIEVYFNLENSWRDATQVVVTMTSTVPGLNLEQNQLAFPLVARGQEYINLDNPLDFTIPADLDPVNARFDFDFQSATPLADSGLTLYQFLGGTQILLVDDDDDDLGEGRPDWSHLYRDALDSLFLPYEYWDVKEQGTPGAN